VIFSRLTFGAGQLTEIANVFLRAREIRDGALFIWSRALGERPLGRAQGQPQRRTSHTITQSGESAPW
jgi:hypothetical protein